MAPVIAITASVLDAKSFAKAIDFSRFSSVTASFTSASTPFVLPLPTARVLISEIFPRITSNLTFLRSSRAVLVRKADAPAPTGSRRILWPSSFAFWPARNIEGIVFLFKVPMLMLRPLQIEVISSTSPSSSLIMGLPPQARMMLATSFTVT